MHQIGKFAPRILIAALRGGSGKTILSIGLIAAWKKQKKSIAPFKKGPDYIDPAWLTLASGVDTHNLDTWMMGHSGALCSFTKYSCSYSI